MELGEQLMEHDDIARKCKVIEPKIKQYQDSFSAIEKVSCYSHKDIIKDILSTICIFINLFHRLIISLYLFNLYNQNNDAILL